MIKVLFGLALVLVAIVLKGLVNITLGDVLLLLAAPILLVYKMLGNRPSFFVYVGFLAGLLGAAAFVCGYIVVPLQYYYSLWGWYGVVAGVVATLLLPVQLFLFLGVALIKGDAWLYVGKFITEVIFGFAGMLLFASCLSASPWERFRKRDADTPA
jgi:hypothetical protein